MIGFLVFLFLLVQAASSLLFYLYLWQIKEYRLDRLLCHLKSRSARKQVFAFFQVFRQPKLIRPVFTLKAWLILAISFSLGFKIWFWFFKNLPLPFSWRSLAALVLLNFLAPLLISSSIYLLQPVVWLGKKLLVFLAKRKISKLKNLRVIGITGSFAKTSVKEMLAIILAEKFRVCRTPQNWNSEIGVAKAILRYLQPEHEIFIAEMGAYKRGEIQEICQLARPEIGVLTGINEQHLALFGSLSEIKKTKYELIKALPKKGLAVFNADNQFVRQLAKQTKKPKRLYSLEAVKRLRVNKKTVSFQWQEHGFSLRLLGSFQVSNFLAAGTVARELGLSWLEIKAASAKIKPLKGTMAPFIGLQGAFFIDDSYNANPAGFFGALDYLEKQQGRKIVITAGMIELGVKAIAIHRRIGRRLAQTVDWLILTKPDFVKEMGQKVKKVTVEENPEKLALFLAKEIRPDDIILLEGRLPGKLINQLK